MSEFKAKRTERSFSHPVEATPEEIFPLLCPQRELEWLDGWEYSEVYLETGFSEYNGVFQTTLTLKSGQTATWMVTNYEPPNRIGFAIFTPGSHLQKLDIVVEPAEKSGSKLTWTRTYTGLSEEGNALAEEIVGDPFTQMMSFIAHSLMHFCKTGEMMKRP
jgi:Polyketide cyclase / dehydrase and lipid transport